MVKRNPIRYTVTAEFEFILDQDAKVANNAESVASATRSYLRDKLTTTSTHGGYRFNADYAYVTAVRKGVSDNE